MNKISFRQDLLPGITHFFVDLSCTALLGRLNLQRPASQIIACATLYNCLAFAFQLPLGMLADLLKTNRITAALGCALIACGAFFTDPLILCLFIGLGNACFHVGAGREALQNGQGTAGAVGRFVAPGALGIFFGPRLSRFDGLIGIFFPTVLLLLGLITLFVGEKATSIQVKANPSVGRQRLFLIGTCMFLTVLLRAYMGTLLQYPNLSGFGWTLTLSVCTFAGKFVGGMLADRFGALHSSLFTQLAASVLLPLSIFFPPLALPGFLLFNTTMAVTATTLYRGLPKYPGTMFGLTTLALFLGVLPRLLNWHTPFFTWWGVGLLCLLSTALLLGGLILAGRRDPHAALPGAVVGPDINS